MSHSGGDEPRRHPLFLITLLVVSVCTAPWPFVGGTARTLAGIPLWLLWSLGMTALLAILTSWGILRYWKPEPPTTPHPEDEPRG